MLAGSPGLSSMMQARHQKHVLDDASRFPRFVFNDAHQAPKTFFLYDASRLPRLVFNDANQAPTNMFDDASRLPKRFFNDANQAPKNIFCLRC